MILDIYLHFNHLNPFYNFCLAKTKIKLFLKVSHVFVNKVDTLHLNYLPEPRETTLTTKNIHN